MTRPLAERRKAIDDLYAVFAPDVVLEAEVEAILARIVAIDAALVRTPETPVADTAGIDAAWREAEAALPEGWAVVMLWRTLQEPWGAHAAPFPTKTGDPGVYAGGDSLAAALLALAAALREDT